MIVKIISILLLSFPIFTYGTDFFKILNLPEHDSVKRVCQLSSASTNLDEFVTENSNGLILILKESPTVNTKGSSNDWAEVTAQLLLKRNMTVCELSLKSGEVSTYGNVGDVVIFHNGKKHVYYGRRSPSAILSFIIKLGTSQLKLITGKLDKIAFDKVIGPKVVGFFMQGTADLTAFETAATKFSPSIPFYVAYDRIVAKHLKLKNVGDIHLVLFSEKLAIPCPVNPASVADIEALINSNKKITLKYYNEYNLHDPSLYDPNKITFIAVGEQTSAIGGYFHKLVTKVIRNVTGQTENPKRDATAPVTIKAPVTVTATTTEPAFNGKDVDIIWIDPNSFPTIHLMMEHLEATYGFPPGLSIYFGTINAADNTSVWFNSALINTTADKAADEANVILLRDWILGVSDNTQAPVQSQADLSGALQQFQVTPVPVRTREKSDFTLECVVQNQVGDCLWLHNGRNIGFNLNRHAPHYSWRGDSANGDCSLNVKGANPIRDSGEWVCEVTGDQTNPTITSSPILVSVIPETLKETLKPLVNNKNEL